MRLQFVAALDAWVALEHSLDKLFYVFLKPISYPKAQLLYSAINGFQNQRETIAALAAAEISDEALNRRTEEALDGARKRATKRNRLIHGVWRHHCRSRSGQKFRLMFRLYIPTDKTKLITATGRDLYDGKGKYVFFIDDLQRCEQEFLSLKSEIDQIRQEVGRVRGVNPEIEIPAEEIAEFHLVRIQPTGDRHEDH